MDIRQTASRRRCQARSSPLAQRATRLTNCAPSSFRSFSVRPVIVRSSQTQKARASTSNFFEVDARAILARPTAAPVEGSRGAGIFSCQKLPAWGSEAPLLATCILSQKVRSRKYLFRCLFQRLAPVPAQLLQ